MKKLVMVSLVTLGICGCSGVSDVVMIGKDTYMVGSTGISPLASGSGLKAKLFREAQKYCDTQSKLPMVLTSASVNMMVGRPANAEITFRCLAENDPEWKRPDMKLAPNTVVEISPPK